MYTRIDVPATGKQIRRLRMERGLSVLQVCEALCLSDVQAVYRWQRGETLPSLDNLLLLSELLGVPIDEILVRSEQGNS